jgi:excisionase family DNA binding protein
VSDEAPTPPEDPWLTLAEIAEELRLSPATIRSWISKGTLRAMRAGQRKWLVRRSELDRMLRSDDFADAPPPPPSPPATGRVTRQRRFPDTITPPYARPRGRDEEVDPDDWLGIAEWEWNAALRHSQMAPPDAWFPGRLRYIAESAARKAAALALLPPDEEVRWQRQPAEPGAGGPDPALSYELRPGGNRPGPPDLWAQFDSTVRRLQAATVSAKAGPLRGALEDLSVTLHDIVDSLERYRGRYGNWDEPPLDEVAADAGDDHEDAAGGASESVS